MTVKGKAARNRREYVSPSTPIQLAHDKLVVTPIVCRPADIDKWKHLLANVEAVINATATCNSEDPTKIFSLVTEAIKAIRPGYAVRLTYVETSGTWVHGHQQTGPDKILPVIPTNGQIWVHLAKRCS